jgi:hypothetical protein
VRYSKIKITTWIIFPFPARSFLPISITTYSRGLMIRHSTKLAAKNRVSPRTHGVCRSIQVKRFRKFFLSPSFTLLPGVLLLLPPKCLSITKIMTPSRFTLHLLFIKSHHVSLVQRLASRRSLGGDDCWEQGCCLDL